MKNYCCKAMEGILEENDTSLNYAPHIRKYFLATYPDHKPSCNDVHTSHTILFCPWCGTALPSNLERLYMRTLKLECGIYDSWRAIDNGKIPGDFQTDAWWKKRGL
jgi:hypothetical protein